MTRDYTKFPDNETGEALWNMAARGDDLSKAREVEFTVVFPTEEKALKFGEILLYNRQKILLCDNEQSEDYPYEIAVSVTMAPTHEEITDYQSLLNQYASDLNGHNDGWCCHTQLP